MRARAKLQSESEKGLTKMTFAVVSFITSTRSVVGGPTTIFGKSYVCTVGRRLSKIYVGVKQRLNDGHAFWK